MATRGFYTPAGRRSIYDPTLSTDFSTNMWKNCPLLEYIHDPTIGSYLNESWQSYNAASTSGDYVLTQATAGTGAISTAAPGVFELDCNSTTQAQGVQVQRLKSAFVPAAGSEIWFECKVKVVDTYDKIQFFAGLAESDTSIIGSGSLSTTNHIGWKCEASGAGVLTFQGKAATSSSTTLAEDTYVKLGFYVNGVTSITQYVNGVATGTDLSSAAIPTVVVYPSFVCQTDGTNDPILHIAGYRVFQTR